MQEIRELLVEEMEDLYDAEKQLVKALPKMAKAASNHELSQAFTSHLHETEGHVKRLEQAFELLGQKPKSKPCAAMKGLIQEAQETIEEDMPDALHDSAIICAAQKVEHYEMAGYGTLSAWAKTLGLEDVAELLEETLEEERAADEKLTDVGSEVLADAADGAAETESPKKGSNGKMTSPGTKRRVG
jgi:ferritin-like metal-binding protein YciE